MNPDLTMGYMGWLASAEHLPVPVPLELQMLWSHSYHHAQLLVWVLGIHSGPHAYIVSTLTHRDPPSHLPSGPCPTPLPLYKRKPTITGRD